MMSDADFLDVTPVGVWVQLLVGEEKQGESFEIEQTPRNVNALKMMLKIVVAICSSDLCIAP